MEFQGLSSEAIAPPQPHPIGQQALRQQRLQLFNPGISHAGAWITAGRDAAGKPKRVRGAAPPATSRPAVTATVRPPSGALAGIESSRVTREASTRGQQSREAMAPPVAAARPAPVPVPSPKANSAETKKPQKAR